MMMNDRGQSMITIYINKTYSTCRAVQLLCKITGIDTSIRFVQVSTEEMNSPKFLKNRNPMGEVPILETDQLKLTSVGSIMKYLCRRFNLNTWYPFDQLEQWSKMESMMDWYLQTVRPTCSQLNSALIIMNSAPNGHKQEMKQEIDIGVSKLNNYLNMLESYIENNGGYVTGDEPSIIDLLIACDLYELHCYGYICTTTNETISKWIDQLEELPQWRDVNSTIIEEGKAFQENRDNLQVLSKLDAFYPLNSYPDANSVEIS
jgi:glutathione S-transferase